MTLFRLKGSELHGPDRVIPCVTGPGGVREDKHEGDGATPSGCLRITGALYRPDRLRADQVPDWARPLAMDDLWSDDPADPFYNRQVRAPHDFSHEALWREDALYDLILLTDWNTAPVVPGRGSAIFIHTWRGPDQPTEGCIAMGREDLLWLARTITPGDAIMTG